MKQETFDPTKLCECGGKIVEHTYIDINENGFDYDVSYTKCGKEF